MSTNRSSELKVAVLGTGLMGAPMARNIRRAGFAVSAWNRTSAKASPLALEGVTIAATPAEAVRGADVVITMLKDAAAIEDALEGVAPVAGRKTWWLQMSTTGLESLGTLNALATKKGLTLIDAPVQGTKQPAETGQLVVLAAGPEAAHAPLKPVLSAIAKEVRWLAPEPGQATRLKLALNAWVFALTHGAAESLALAKGLGVDPALVVEIVKGGPLDSPFFQIKAKAMISGDYSPAFTIENALKDSALVLAAAKVAGVKADLALAGLQRYQRADLHGHGQSDIAASFVV